MNSSSYTANDILTKIKTVDGSGSLLDSDLLDGYHGSFYGSYDNRTLGNDIDFNAITYDFQNKLLISSPFHVPNYTGQINYPYSGYGQILTFGGSAGMFPFQLAVADLASGKAFFRCQYKPGSQNNTGISTTWKEFYHSGNAKLTTVD
ncbi:hypothetical protein [Gaoshiqia sediminis]|uniref:Uncharacterized protein n=1 Tax=Gaoshiqia sediminis TaxID=2986998 RepID=A0AA41Y9W7_9BACT|nr:hypothetical protein [Gaoshiqia sediminis]MCW0484650.1 hypothetical protein [Gaoshiqia sediminis]